jgi:hypothetical protein
MSKPAIPNEYFEHYRDIQAIPSDEKGINLLFDELVNDMDLSDETTINLLSYSIDSKKRFLEEQYELLSEVPSPEFVLKCLKISIRGEVLQILSFYLKSQPISWTDRFLKANGVSFLEEQIDAILKKFHLLMI